MMPGRPRARCDGAGAGRDAVRSSWRPVRRRAVPTRARTDSADARNRIRLRAIWARASCRVREHANVRRRSVRADGRCAVIRTCVSYALPSRLLPRPSRLSARRTRGCRTACAAISRGAAPCRSPRPQAGHECASSAFRLRDNSWLKGSRLSGSRNLVA